MRTKRIVIVRLIAKPITNNQFIHKKTRQVPGSSPDVHISELLAFPFLAKQAKPYTVGDDEFHQ